MAFSLDMESLRALLGYFSGVNYWKVLAVIFALFNLKNLPFAWHVSSRKFGHSAFIQSDLCPSFVF